MFSLPSSSSLYTIWLSNAASGFQCRGTLSSGKPSSLDEVLEATRRNCVTRPVPKAQQEIKINSTREQNESRDGSREMSKKSDDEISSTKKSFNGAQCSIISSRDVSVKRRNVENWNTCIIVHLIYFLSRSLSSSLARWKTSRTMPPSSLLRIRSFFRFSCLPLPSSSSR